MANRTQTQLLHVGNYMAKLEIELEDEPEAWGPHVAPEVLERIDTVRAALRQGDIDTASEYAEIYSVQRLVG